MKFTFRIVLIILVSISSYVLPDCVIAQSKTTFGIVGGAGLPIGEWGNRWDPFSAGEVNLAYEFTPGTGFLLIVGKGQAGFAGLSQWGVFNESTHGQMREEVRDGVTLNVARQTGIFEQIPMGFGFFKLIDLGRIDGYGSLAMMVYNWKVQRSQELDYTVAYPDGTTREGEPIIWDDTQIGTSVGGQLAVGALYELTHGLQLDLSFAYHLVNISDEYGALAYYGYPARQIPGEDANELISKSNGQSDFLQFRLGLRFGG
ncbi:hypothetical protein ACFLQV_00110 [Calditrichota bacterium]